LRPALGEYARRVSTIPALLSESLLEYLRSPLRRDFLASFQRLSQAIPTGLFNNAGVDDFLTRLFSLPGMTNDFRRLRHRLYLVATDLDSGTAIAFGAEGHDHVPSRRRYAPVRRCRASSRRWRSTVAGMSTAR
jgi:NTE family protein